MGLEHDGAARRFVTATVFHAHVAILHDIRASDAVFRPYDIEMHDDFRRSHLTTIH